MAHQPLAPLGIGLIGVGRHGGRYGKHIANDLSDVRLAAVSRREASEGVAWAPAVPCYLDYHDLIADPRVDAVVVVTPPALHRDICLAVAQAKKALLVEKPLAPTADAAREIARAVQRSQQVMMMAQTLRFDATIIALQQRQAKIGALQYLSLASRMEHHGLSETTAFGGRGCLIETGIHILDLVRVLTKDEVQEVSCDMDIVPPRGAERRVVGRFMTRGGLVSQLDVSRVSSGRIGRVELIGTEGQLSADWCERKVVQVSAQHGNEEWPIIACQTVLSALRAFVLAMRNSLPPPVSIEDGKRAVEIAEACYTSAQEGGRVVSVEYA